jgi:Leucine-rich repeat (LRR) protein
MKLYNSLSSALSDAKNVRALKVNIKEEFFPSSLFNLPNLSELYLEGNCIEFPDKIHEWKELKVLSIKLPKLKCSLSSAFTLPQLENLKVIETPIEELSLPLGHVPSPLKYLTLKGCKLTKLPEEVSMLSKLVELAMPQNNLETLPYSFVELSLLKRLNLDQNKFKKFPDFFKEMPTLSHLSIDGNNFDELEKERVEREFHLTIE